MSGINEFARTYPGAFASWRAMRRRCSDPKCTQWPRYGGRGIRICERWKSLENFCQDMGDRPKGYTLDRIDNDGPYSPENCRWASKKEQRHNNSMPLRMLTVNGVTKCVGEWKDEPGAGSISVICRRKKRGYCDEHAIFGRPDEWKDQLARRYYAIKPLPKRPGRKPTPEHLRLHQIKLLPKKRGRPRKNPAPFALLQARRA